jgi:hypothetical protein
MRAPKIEDVSPWAQESLRSTARRIAAEEEGAMYDAALNAVIAWWVDEVEAAGDWDVYGDPLTSAIEKDYRASTPAAELQSRVEWRWDNEKAEADQ